LSSALLSVADVCHSPSLHDELARPPLVLTARTAVRRPGGPSERAPGLPLATIPTESGPHARTIALQASGRSTSGSLPHRCGEPVVSLVQRRIHSGEPLADVRVEILGRNGLPVLAATTAADGHAHFPDLRSLRRQRHVSTRRPPAAARTSTPRYPTPPTPCAPLVSATKPSRSPPPRTAKSERCIGSSM
jgi:hypothetical protein